MRVRARSGALAFDVALKAAVVALLVFAVARPDLPRFHGKSMTGRAIGYPLAALLVPVSWFVLSRRRHVRYPVAVDILVVAPFVIDMAGNAANLYDTVSWWSPELRTAYHDTLGDLTLGLAGSVVAAAGVVWFGRRPRPTS